METERRGDQMNYKIVTTKTGHCSVVLETLKKNGVMYLENKEKDLTSLEAIKKLPEVKNNKGVDHLIFAYSRARWMSVEVSKEITQFLHSCRVCQKFSKSVSRPRITLPKSSAFNEVVTLDLKIFKSKSVPWIIDSFCRLMQGKIILNMRANTIINAIRDTWIRCFGIPSVGFNANNGGEFSYLKID